MLQSGEANQAIRTLFGCFGQDSRKKLDFFLNSSTADILASILEIVESGFLISQEEGRMIEEAAIPDDFLQLLVRLIDWKKLSSEPNFSYVYTIVAVLCAWYPKSTGKLIEYGLIEALVGILKQEHINRVSITRSERSYFVKTADLISIFLPAIPSSPCFEGVNTLAGGILFSGYCFDEKKDDAKTNILIVLHAALRPVYNICWQMNSLSTNKVLLLKLIYWANAMDVFERFFVIQVFANFIDRCISSDVFENVTIGTAMMSVMITNYIGIFTEPRFIREIQNVRPKLKDKGHEWMVEFYDVLLSAEQSERGEFEMINYCFKYESFYNSVHQKSKLVRLMLECILPHVKHTTYASCDMGVCHSRLTYFIEKIFNLPRNAKNYKGQLKLQSDGIENFESLVHFVSCTIDDLQESCNESIENLISFNEYDLVSDSRDPRLFCLGLKISPSISRVLCAPKSLIELKCNPMAQALKLLSIFHEVNENWGSLFRTLTQGRVIDIKYFTSSYFERLVLEQINHFNVQSCFIPNRTQKFILKYPFLLSYSIRKDVLAYLIREKEKENADEILLRVPRRNIIKFLEENVKLDQIHPNDGFRFTFENEMGTGNGPTKEFYSKFSQECQRHDLNVWIGNVTKGTDDQLCTSSPCGLFPAPHGKARESTLEVIGCFMAESILEDMQLDINFSSAFYKILFNPNNQPITLNDIKDVMPNVYNFVKELVNAYREKKIIMRDKNFTPEEKSKAISEITCYGSSVHDLYLNFTVPGFPDLEMMKGGSDVPLTIDNIEKYLMMLVYWLLYAGPKKTFDMIRTAFDRFLPVSYIKLFHPDEMDGLVCGLTVEHWTVDYLKGCCQIDEGISADSQSIQNLFEILSSLSPSDQRLFLQFVTSSSRLPAGGLKYLDPPLTIAHSGSETSLPTSMTCFNVLFISGSVSKEVLQEKILLAIREGADSFQFV